MNGLGLSPEALEQRRKFIQGGDALAIVEGRWHDLWMQKTGRAQDADLSNELRLQLGSYTEPFNLAWCAKQTGRQISYFSSNPLVRMIWQELTAVPAIPGEHVVHATIPYLAANLDAITVNKTGVQMYLDAKWLSRADEKEISRYTPQGTHCALVTGCDWWGLSIIAGGRWELVEQEVDPFFAAEYLAKCEEFWRFVVEDREPPDAAPIARPRPQFKLRNVQLEDEWRSDWPNWGAQMVQLFQDAAGTYPAWAKHNISKEDMKALLPEDVGRVTRGLVSLSRDKANKVHWSIKKDKDNG